LAYSPLQQGLLTGKIEPGHKFKKGDNRANSVYFTDENISRVNKMLDKLKPIAEEKNATLAQLVIQWTINQHGITIALVGARTPEQSTQNASAADLKLSTEELDFIDTQVNELNLQV
jgi:aryl-alcohol dehydrogenase-like predicted oxidoreductase